MMFACLSSTYSLFTYISVISFIAIFRYYVIYDIISHSILVVILLLVFNYQLNNEDVLFKPANIITQTEIISLKCIPLIIH